jgi:hypothetical protein
MLAENNRCRQKRRRAKPMTNIELYLTAYLRYESAFVMEKELIDDIKRFSDRDTIYIVRFACPRTNAGCNGLCFQCWESHARQIREEGGPAL